MEIDPISIKNAFQIRLSAKEWSMRKVNDAGHHF